jgi:hydrocephalus-inducing protein
MNIPIDFLPLQPKESTGRIVLSSPELGIYQYDLKLNAIPCGLERSLIFKVGLGSQQIQTFRFLSFAKQKTDYNCKVENSEFTVEKTVSAPAGKYLV